MTTRRLAGDIDGMTWVAPTLASGWANYGSGTQPCEQVTGMRLGTGVTAVAKTGAGAAIVTYVTASQKVIDGSFPTSALSGASRRIQWKTTWIAGEATANSIAEVVITNESPLTNVAGTAAK